MLCIIVMKSLIAPFPLYVWWWPDWPTNINLIPSATNGSDVTAEFFESVVVGSSFLLNTVDFF